MNNIMLYFSLHKPSFHQNSQNHWVGMGEDDFALLTQLAPEFVQLFQSKTLWTSHQEFESLASEYLDVLPKTFHLKNTLRRFVREISARVWESGDLEMGDFFMDRYKPVTFQACMVRNQNFVKIPKTGTLVHVRCQCPNLSNLKENWIQAHKALCSTAPPVENKFGNMVVNMRECIVPLSVWGNIRALAPHDIASEMKGRAPQMFEEGKYLGLGSSYGQGLAYNLKNAFLVDEANMIRNWIIDLSLRYGVRVRWDKIKPSQRNNYTPE